MSSRPPCIDLLVSECPPQECRPERVNALLRDTTSRKELQAQARFSVEEYGYDDRRGEAKEFTVYASGALDPLSPYGACRDASRRSRSNHAPSLVDRISAVRPLWHGRVEGSTTSSVTRTASTCFSSAYDALAVEPQKCGPARAHRLTPGGDVHPRFVRSSARSAVVATSSTSTLSSLKTTP